MKRSQLFTKTLKQAPSDEVSENAKLLIRAGFVHKEMAGAYDYLPLGKRVFDNIVQIIREEMNAVGAQELEMTSLQDPSLWKKTGRWSDEVVDVWFKTALQNGNELGLGFTHEEPISRLLSQHISSYKDLPVLVYQFQKKFRNEIRSKSGVMRGREFVMKDMYSLSKSQEEHDAFYEKSKEVYMRVFDRLGLGEKTYITFASGGVFSKFSHEFQTECVAGEDFVYVDEDSGVAVNEEVFTDEVLEDLGLEKSKMVKKKTAEVGNIFNLGTKFSEPLKLTFTNEDGVEEPVIMGSYGIGPGRTMGVIVESMADEKGLVWPEAIAPFTYVIVTLAKSEDEESYVESEKLYQKLSSEGVEVLWDDRTSVGPGQKFADAELMGIPYMLTISKRSIDAGGVEYQARTGGAESEIRSLDSF